MNKATKTKATQGIRAFLEMRGFEIIEDGWGKGKSHVDFIARDEKTRSKEDEQLKKSAGVEGYQEGC